MRLAKLALGIAATVLIMAHDHVGGLAQLSIVNTSLPPAIIGQPYSPVTLQSLGRSRRYPLVLYSKQLWRIEQLFRRIRTCWNAFNQWHLLLRLHHQRITRLLGEQRKRTPGRLSGYD